MADNGLMLIITLSVLAVIIIVAGFILAAKRHPPKAQETYNEHSVLTDTNRMKF